MRLFSVSRVDLLYSKSPSETTVSPQTFIDKTLMISYTSNRPIYIKRKEGGKRLAAGETERERERVCVCARDGVSLKTEVAFVVKMAIGETDHFGIS